MTLDQYIDTNIKLLTFYLRNPSLPMSREAVNVCFHRIHEANLSGTFDEMDAKILKLELKQHSFVEKFIRRAFKIRLTIKRLLRKICTNINYVITSR